MLKGAQPPAPTHGLCPQNSFGPHFPALYIFIKKREMSHLKVLLPHLNPSFLLFLSHHCSRPPFYSLSASQCHRGS